MFYLGATGFQSKIELPYLHCGDKHNVLVLRSISGTTVADLYGCHLAASPVIAH